MCNGSGCPHENRATGACSGARPAPCLGLDMDTDKADMNGMSGASGISGISGASGMSGISGASGVSGMSGISGASGVSGMSGVSGILGASGMSGASGISATNGIAAEAIAHPQRNGHPQHDAHPLLDGHPQRNGHPQLDAPTRHNAHPQRGGHAASGAARPETQAGRALQCTPYVQQARRFCVSVASDAFCPACAMAHDKYVRLRAYTELPALYCPICQEEFHADEVAEHCAALLDGIRNDLEHMQNILDELHTLRKRPPAAQQPPANKKLPDPRKRKIRPPAAQRAGAHSKQASDAADA